MSSFNPTRVQALFEELRDAVIPEITTMEQHGSSKEDVFDFSHSFTDDWLAVRDKEFLLSGKPPLSEADKEQIRFRLKELLGAGALEGLLSLTDVENIHVFGSHRAVLTYNDGRKEEIGPITESDETLIELVRHLASVGSRTSRRFDQSSPILDLRLPSGHRMLAIMEVSARPHLSIRRHATHKVDFEYLISMGSITPEVAGFLECCVVPPAPINMLIAGGTNTGKTTFMRGLISTIPKQEVLVTIEDTLELHLTKTGSHERCYELETRTANIEGAGEITMYDLAKAALRMAPDRVIVGEVRGGEVMQLLTAMGQGNDGSMGTIHANSSQAVISRILTYSQRSPDASTPDFVLRQVGETLHLVIFLQIMENQKRIVSSIREVIGYESGEVLTAEIFNLNEDNVLTYRRPLSPKGETFRRLKIAGYDFSQLGDPVPEEDVMMFYPRRTAVTVDGSLDVDEDAAAMSSIREFETEADFASQGDPALADIASNGGLAKTYYPKVTNTDEPDEEVETSEELTVAEDMAAEDMAAEEEPVEEAVPTGEAR